MTWTMALMDGIFCCIGGLIGTQIGHWLARRRGWRSGMLADTPPRAGEAKGDE